MIWDPFDHSEGSLRPNVKKVRKKVSKWVLGASRPGGTKTSSVARVLKMFGTNKIYASPIFSQMNRVNTTFVTGG